jgi:hypothetical protein
MGDDPTHIDGTETLEQLQVTLNAALNLATELSSDRLLQRMLSAFRSMPEDDRPVIIGVLEREVLGRLLSRGTERPVGGSTHPNPNARLYIRAHDSDFDRRAFDRDGMMIADIRGLRIATIIRNIPAVRQMFQEAMREALDHVDPETWTIAEELLHDVLACIADARAAQAQEPSETPPVPPTSAGADTDTAPPRNASKPTRRS